MPLIFAAFCRDVDLFPKTHAPSPSRSMLGRRATHDGASRTAPSLRDRRPSLLRDLPIYSRLTG